jgi:hypothetical protein
VYISALTIALNRIFRCLLAYINERTKRILSDFWVNGGSTSEFKNSMNENERRMLGGYRKLVSNYQSTFPLDLNLFTDMEPPKDLLIEIKAFEDCGEIILDNG